MMVDVFIAASIVVIVYYLLKPNGYLSVPFLFGCVCLGWIAPQLTTLVRTHPNLDDSLQAYAFMSVLCLFATILGFEIGRRSRKNKPVSRGWIAQVMDEAYAAKVALVLTVIAVLMTFLIGATSLEERTNSMWTGRITIYYFFQNIKFVSLFLSLCLLFKRVRAFYIGLVVVNLALYFPFIFVHFRRRAIFEACFAVALAIYYVRDFKLPRVFVISSIIIASIGVFAIGELRSLSYDQTTQTWSVPSMDEIRNVDFLATAPLVGNVPSPEVLNAVTLMSAMDSGGELTLGRVSWNRLVFQFVPAQFLGAEFKNSLMFEDVSVDIVLNNNGFRRSRGSTITGFAEAYMEFSYLGCFIFFIYAWILGIAWRNLRGGGVFGALTYAICAIPFVITPTAYAAYFIALGFPQILFLILAIGLVFVVNATLRSQHHNIQYS